MLFKTRLAAVIQRRIAGATKRGDINRKKKLCAILGLMKRGDITPGQALIDIRFKSPVVKKSAVVRLAGKLPFTPKPKRRELKGGL
jgi:hypothetical protein